MSLQTADGVSTELRQDLAWRRKEIYSISAMAESATNRQAMLRGALAVVYAHWEGYVRYCCKVYYTHVSSRRLKLSDLSIPFMSLAAHKHFLRNSEVGKLERNCQFMEWLVKEWDSRAHLPKYESLFVSNNLRSDVLKSFLSAIGLQYDDEYRVSEKPIDEMVDLRNRLAHGHWQVVEMKEFIEMKDRVIRLMEKLCDQIETAAASQRYKRRLIQIGDSSG